MTARPLKILIIIFCCHLLGSPMAVQADSSQAKEYEVKAAFLYNFANFVKWPEDAFSDEQSPLYICIVGDNPFGEALNLLKEKSVQNRDLVVKHYPEAQLIEPCQVLFVSASLAKNLPEILQHAKEKNMLTVSDMAGFAEQGGIIGLVTVQNKIRFEINIKAAEQHGLTISSRLLKLAKVINK